MKRSPASSLFLGGIALLCSAAAWASPPALSLKTVCNNQILAPTAITNAGDGSKRLFVCDQVGKVWVIQDEMVRPTPFLDISSKIVPLTNTYDERGLLSVAFHPGFANPASPGYKKFYVFYSAVSPNALEASTPTPSAISATNPCTITTATPHGLPDGTAVTVTGISGGAFSPSINGSCTATVVDANNFTVPVNCTSNSGVSFTGSHVLVNNPVNCRSTVSEFQVSATNPNAADPTTERVLMAWDKPQLNHNGGQLAFSPVDGCLYITVGDGGSQHDNDFGHTGGSISGGSQFIVTGTLGNAQDLTKLLGKILRIDPLGTNGPGGAYGIPSDNPFASTGGGVRPEIYTYGMRNPWRLSFDTDPVLGTRLIEADVGQDTIEEVNLIVAGGNYGWRIKEGTIYHDSTAPNSGGTLIDPVAEYAHPSSPIGPISAISIGSPSCTVTTPTAHNLPNGASITISSVPGGTFSSSINGTFTATVISPTQFTVPVNCTSAYVMVSSIATGDQCTVTTPYPHNLTTGMSVTIGGITGGTFSQSIDGTFTATVISPTQFMVPVSCTSNSGITYNTNSRYTYDTGLTRIGTSVIGGYVYRGSAIPALVGQYVFAEYSANGIGSAGGLVLTLDSGTWALSQPTVVGLPATYINALGPDESGELYVAAKTAEGPNPTVNPPSGFIYKIVPAQVSNVTLHPVQQNTLFSESSALANATGDFFAGETAGGSKRREVMKFDIASNVPSGSAIASAQLTLNLNNTGASAAGNMSLFKTSQSWGAAGSYSTNGAGTQAAEGDATWGDRFYDPTSATAWGVAGGSHITTASATTSVGTTLGQYSWSSTQMATDVQSWLKTPANNFGWLLFGDETTVMTAREFSATTNAANPTPANLLPALQITYAVAPALTWRETWLRTYFAPSVNGVPTVGKYLDDTVDANGNGVSNLLEYAWAFNPTTANSSSPGIQTTETNNGANTTYTMTFRRDPRAGDLTYQLQTSNDLVNWTTIVQSAGGTMSSGSGFVSETPVAGQSPVVTVSASETLPSPTKHFSRLIVTRATQ